MQDLSKDLLEKITNELSLQDFLNFCEVNKKFCSREDIFNRRFKKDFGERTYNHLSEENKQEIRKTYLEWVETVSKTAEKITKEIMSEYGEWSKFLSPDYKNMVRNTFFEIFYQASEKLLKEIEPTQHIRDEEYLEAIIDDFIGDYKYGDNTIKWESLFPPFNLRDEYKWADLVDDHLTKYVKQIWEKYLKKQVVKTIFPHEE